MENIPQLKDGAEWPEHEDCIIGNEEGLRNLISACEVAIEKGEYYGSDLGDYTGVKKIGSDWFQNPIQSRQSRVGNFILTTIVCAIIALFFIGIFTVLDGYSSINT